MEGLRDRKGFKRWRKEKARKRGREGQEFSER